MKFLPQMKQKPLLLLFLVVIFFLFSCKENKRHKEVTKILNEWIGKEILFPENVPCYVVGKDVLPELCSELFQEEYKILMYVDSTGCSDCRLRLFDWQQLIEEADSLFQGRVRFLLYFQPKSEREMALLFARDRFDYPVFMDFNGSLNRLNRFRHEMQYQCFLLDKDNKVIMMGNPALNPRIWDLYKEQIGNSLTLEEGTRDSETLTLVNVDKIQHNYGTVAIGGSSNLLSIQGIIHW